jgi:hypothetical protein
MIGSVQFIFVIIIVVTIGLAVALQPTTGIKIETIKSPDLKNDNTRLPAKSVYESIDKFLYINLDKRDDRRAHIESVLLTKLRIPGEKVERIPAIIDTPGWKGCTRSHLRAIQLAIQSGYEYVCIFEDDFDVLDIDKFTHELEKAWRLLVVRGFDVIMLAMTPVILKRQQTDPLYKIQNSLAMPGYIVSRPYLTRLESIYTRAIREHKQLDLLTQQDQSTSNWYGFFPPLARQLPSFSDIEDRETDYTQLENGYLLQFVN